MEFDFSINGNEALLRAVKNLPNSMRNKALRPALREGAKIIKIKVVDNIKSAASDEATGLFARSIVVRTLKMKGKAMRVAVTIGKAISKKSVRVGLYGSVFEFGKSNQAPRPVFRPAISQGANQAISEIINQARNRLSAAIDDAKR